MTKTLVAFGCHDREASHVHTILDAYRADGWTIADVHTAHQDKLGKIVDLVRKWRGRPKRVSEVLVTFPGHHLMPIAWLLTRFPRRHLSFEAMISLYDTAVHDRKLVKEGSPRARWLKFLDRLSCRLADTVIIDTQTHAKYFVDTFGVPERKMRVIYITSRKELLPMHVPRTDLTTIDVFFYGTYIPLQGVEHILDAAAIVQKSDPSIRFTLVGGGQTFKPMKEKMVALGLANVTLEPFMPFTELLKRLARADLALGIFGTTAKAGRVIPHKVVDAVTSGVPVITRDSPAIRERYADHSLVTLCPPGDPASLAQAILAKASALRTEKR